jgi:hypothetical protein
MEASFCGKKVCGGTGCMVKHMVAPVRTKKESGTQTGKSHKPGYSQTSEAHEEEDMSQLQIQDHGL